MNWLASVKFLQSQMEESRDCDQMGLQLQDGTTGNHIQSDHNMNKTEMPKNKTNQLDFYFVKFSPSPLEVEREKAKTLYSLMSHLMSFIIQEIDKRKKDENQLTNTLKWFAYLDKQIERKIQLIKNYKEALAEEKPDLPMRSIPRTAGYLQLTEKDAQTPVDIGTSRKRCHNRLKKGRMDLQYLKHVQEELLSSMKSGQRPVHGTQELNNVMISLVQRIQHGNNNRAVEAKLFDGIRNIKDTIETYTAPIDPYNYRKWGYSGGPRGLAKRKQYHEHQLKLLSNEIEVMMSDQIARTAKIKRINAELIHVRKNIKCMERVLEKVYTKRMKAYNCGYKLGDQEKKNEMDSSYSEYQSIITYVKELAATDKKVEEIMRQWTAMKRYEASNCHCDLDPLITL